MTHPPIPPGSKYFAEMPTGGYTFFMGPFPMGSTEGFIVWLNREDCPKDLTECDRIPWVRGIIAAVAIEAIHEHEDRLFSMDPKIVNKATRDWKVAYGNKTPEEAKIEWRAWRDEE